MAVCFKNFHHFNLWLNDKGLFHMELGLDRMLRALAKLNIPKFPIIQVIGTNGKGSTSAFIASLAKEHGLKCGLFISPHFISVRERVSLNNKLFSEEEWVVAINNLNKLINIENLTYFEIITLLAMWMFSQKKVDLAIFEAGLGGKNDGTSSLPSIAHCFTPIAMDHANIIGPKLVDIAKDKAGAIQPHNHVFSAPQYPHVRDVITNACRKNNCHLIFTQANTQLKSKNWKLEGTFQNINASLAIKVWEWFAKSFNIKSSLTLIEQGINNAFLPGRLQKIKTTSKIIILDGAHNPHAIHNLIKQPIPKPNTIFYSTLADKDWQTSLALLVRTFPDANFYLLELDNKRAETFINIANFLIHMGIKDFFKVTNFKEAIENCAGPVLICGSLYLLAEFYRYHPHCLGLEYS